MAQDTCGALHCSTHGASLQFIEAVLRRNCEHSTGEMQSHHVYIQDMP